MASCEKCWADAYNLSRISGKSQAEHYQDLIKEKGYNPCSPEEQAGIDATDCPKCGRKTIHQYADYCTNCFYVNVI